MPIKASILTQPQRTTTATLVVPNDEGGGVHEEKVRVVYFSPSIQWWKDRVSTDEEFDWCRRLAETIAELPDILDDDGNAQPPTFEFFRSMTADNLKRISDAISEDMDPEKKSPSKPLPNTSAPADETVAPSMT